MIVMLCDRCGQPFTPPSWYGTGSHTVMITILNSEGIPEYFNFDTDPNCTSGAEGVLVSVFAHSPLAIAYAAAQAASGAGTGGAGTGSGAGTSSDGAGTSAGSGTGSGTGTGP